jgi:hypothetical protein
MTKEEETITANDTDELVEIYSRRRIDICF